MPETLNRMTQEVIKPVHSVANVPVSILKAGLGIDAMMGKNPVKSVGESMGTAMKDVMLMPLKVAKEGIVGATRLALSTLAGVVTGGAKAAGKAVLNAPVIPGRR